MNAPSHQASNWRKSSYSGRNTNCVEVADGPITKVRDTQNRRLGALAFDSAEWRAFLSTAKRDAR